MNPTELPDDCNDSIEHFAHDGSADIATAEPDIENPDVENPDIENHVRMGPGSIDALRFKWTVRKESNGYFVDETIGASRSAFSTGPMPRDEVIAFVDARERDACERLERTRQKFAAAMPVGAFALAGALPSSSRPAVQPAEPAPFLSPEQDQLAETNADTFDFETVSVETLTIETSAVETSADDTSPETTEQRSNVDDVMDRIARLLDER